MRIINRKLRTNLFKGNFKAAKKSQQNFSAAFSVSETIETSDTEKCLSGKTMHTRTRGSNCFAMVLGADKKDVLFK